MTGLPLQYSKRQVDRAADVWRKGLLGGDVTVEEMMAALEVVDHFRACHQYPLIKATNGLRSTIRTVGAPTIQVSQRLKRFPTILNKLTREPTMKLSRMQDIGGCRAVVPDIDTVRRAQRQLERRRGYKRTSDYVAEPRSSGYRGVHVVVEYDTRAIEIQLRTRVMHEWAISVEKLSYRLSEDLKSGVGPPEVIDLYQVVSEAMALEERGSQVPDDLLELIKSKSQRAVEYLAANDRRQP